MSETKEAVTATAEGATAAKPSNLPRLKESTIEQAERIRAHLKLDATTNTIPVPRESIEPELTALGTSFDELTKLAAGLHNLKASTNLATGQVALEHWKTQKTDERGPVVASMSAWDGESTTFTHIPASVERLPGRTETVVVHGQTNIQNHTTIGRNVGQMAATRAHLRAHAAEALANK